jgi:hypothetical protein
MLSIVGEGQPSGSHAPIDVSVTPDMTMSGSPQTEVAAGPSGAEVAAGPSGAGPGAGPGAGAGSADACTERSSAMIGSRAEERRILGRGSGRVYEVHCVVILACRYTVLLQTCKQSTSAVNVATKISRDVLTC